MVSRQAGHFFFEPKGYDQVNNATHEHKEDIKVGYNLRRKIVLLSIWAFHPRCCGKLDAVWDLSIPFRLRHFHLVCRPNLAGRRLWRPAVSHRAAVFHQGRPYGSGVDDENPHHPFHDFMLYYRAPLYLMAGQLIDPMDDVGEREPFEQYTTPDRFTGERLALPPQPSACILPRRRYEPVGDHGKCGAHNPG